MSGTSVPASGAALRPQTPDFDVYPIDYRVVSAEPIPRGVRVCWDDGLESRFHVMWLRENSPDPQTIHPVTREQVLLVTEIAEDLAADAAAPTTDGGLWVRWSPDKTESRFHAGWLRAHAVEARGEHAALPARRTWRREMQQRIPRFDGVEALAEERVFGDWLMAIHVHGFGVLEGLPIEPTVIEHVPALIGPIRPTNFGFVFDVRAKAEADSNAYTMMALPVHTDLCTREYAPGLQFLHCLRNDAAGGDTLLADGFQVAEQLRQEAPPLFDALCTVPLSFVNKAKDSDYRWAAPMIAVDRDGKLDEVRVSPWLRGPLIAPLEQVDVVYQALRRYLELARRPELQIEFRLQPGDLIGFDNRRILHGRTGIAATAGGRWLRGCYAEREELYSRLRIIARRARERTAGGNAAATLS